jgi:hypothetical protein
MWHGNISHAPIPASPADLHHLPLRNPTKEEELRYTGRSLSGDTAASRHLNAPGTTMGHDWIFDVLKDLRTYALSNDLPALAAKAEDALRVAEVEIAAKMLDGSGGAVQGGPHSKHRH